MLRTWDGVKPLFVSPGHLCDHASARRLTLAVEGPLWMATSFDRQWDDPDRRRLLLDFLSRVETEPSILGVSAHMLTVARRR